MAYGGQLSKRVQTERQTEREREREREGERVIVATAKLCETENKRTVSRSPPFKTSFTTFVPRIPVAVFGAFMAIPAYHIHTGSR